MPLYDHAGVKVLTNADLRQIGAVLLDHPLPMRWTHGVMERLHAVMTHPEERPAPEAPAPAPAEPVPAPPDEG